jgi:hypothetical protein
MGILFMPRMASREEIYVKKLTLIAVAAILAGCASLSGPPNPEATDATFAALKPGVDTQATVAQKLGRPYDTTYLSLRDMNVWSYKYRQAGIWHSLMHVHFDRNGVLRELMAGPDPDYEERRAF